MLSKSYGSTVQYVKFNVGSKKKGKASTHRDLKGRVFPKASIHKLAEKASIKRLSSGPSDGTDKDKNAYNWIDRKTFDIMENVLYDAIGFTVAASKNGMRIIKERHMLKALERYGAMGLGSLEARRTIF